MASDPGLHECKGCLAEVSILMKGDLCHRCFAFERPDPYATKDPGKLRDFPLEESVLSEPSQTYYCIGCGGNQFIVGRADYQIMIKCKGCDWERRIHMC